MKKNTFKRVLAGSLALLTVAAYVPANVGGLIQTSLVADAAASATTQKVTFDFDVAKDYLTSVDYGGNPWNEATLGALNGRATMDGNTVVTVNSKIPLTLTSSKDFSSSLTAFELGTTLTVPGEKVDTTPSADSQVYLVSENGTISSKTVTDAVYNALDDKSNYFIISNSTTYLYNGIYYTSAANIPESASFSAGVKTLSVLETQLKNDYSLASGNEVVISGTPTAPATLDTVDYNAEDKTLTFKAGKDGNNKQKKYAADISSASASVTNCIDILTVDTTKYGTFTAANTTNNTPASFSKNYPVSTVMNEVLKANNYETDDATFTTDSEFVAVGKNAFLLVRFSAKETKNNDGTYKYDFTVPNIGTSASGTDNAITVGTIAQNATVDFYKSETARTNDEKGTTTEGTTVNAKWKSLTIQVGDVTTTPAPANLAKISGGISSADIAVASNTIETFNLTNTANNELFVGAPVTVTNAEPFALYIDDGSNAQMLTASVTYKDNKFVGTFTMPKYAGSATDGKVTLKFVELTETYTYKTTADKTTLTASGQSVTNTEAASIAVKSYDAESTTGYFIENGDKGVDVDSESLEYGRDIVIKLTAGDKFISAGDVTITKDSKDVWANGTASGVNNISVIGSLDTKKAGLIKIDNATSGEYKITYKVTTAGTNPSTYTLEKTFTVDAKGAITIDNISLKVSVYKDNTPIRTTTKSNSAPGLMDIIEDNTDTKFGVDGTGDDAVAYYKIQCEKGKTAEILLSKAAKEIVEKNGYQFRITPVVTPKNEDPLADTKYTVRGYTTGSKNKDYTVSVTITDPEYGGSASAEPIVIPWKVVDYDSKPDFETSATATVAQEDTNKLGDAIATAIAKNDAAKALTGSDFTFEYVTGASGANRVGEAEDELDSYESGLPTEKGNYTVYVTYKDKVVSTVTVTVTSYKLTLVPDASTLAFTYGKDFTVDNYTLKDANDKVVKDVTISDLGVQFMQPIYKEVNGKKVQTGKYEVYRTHDEGSTSGTYDVPNANNVAYVAEVKSSLGYKTTDSATITLNVPTDATTMSNVISVEDLATAFDKTGTSVTEKLNAGTYYVKFSGTASNDDYALDTETVYEVTVSRKKLSDSTVTVLIAPAQYAKNTTQSPNASSITALDTDTGFNFTKVDDSDTTKPPTPLLKLTESFSAVNTGEYDVEVGLTDTQTQNYEGTATAKWHIVNATSNYTASTFNLQWNTAKTTLFDNGRIHVEITKKDASKLAIGDNTIQQYGVIIEKEGKIPAPKEYTNQNQNKEKEAAEQQLVLNNGFTTGGYTTKDIEVIDEKTGKVIEVRNANSVTYSANIRVVDAETGVWARPYVLLSDGTVAYGDARYLNIQNEAQEKLNLNMPYKNTSDVVRVSNMTDAQKKEASKYVNAGYDVLLNKYYAYATFTDLSNEGFRDTVLEVADFGVVVDKNGIFKADETDIDKKLRIGKNSKLIVGHYKKGNKNLAGDNEYTANITPVDSVTGVWVRPYLDLGGGLIVYGTAQYFESASDYFNNKGVNDTSAPTDKQNINPGIGDLSVTKVSDANKAQVKFAPEGDTLAKVQARVTEAYQAAATGNKAKDAPTVKVKQAGVVLDKKGVLKMADGKTWAANGTGKTNVADTVPATDATTLYPTANTGLILGKGFVEGKKTSNFTANYTGKVSPVGKDLIVRNYVIYEIGDTELTVYGEPKAYQYDGTFWKAINEQN